uniref:Protein S100-A16 n=1 Tax=Rhinopithecus roxellana TaxID=61622 RepID=A0A2K6Q940_RHIRO
MTDTSVGVRKDGTQGRGQGGLTLEAWFGQGPSDWQASAGWRGQGSRHGSRNGHEGPTESRWQDRRLWWGLTEQPFLPNLTVACSGPYGGCVPVLSISFHQDLPGPTSRRSREMSDCYTELEKAVIVLVENFYKYVSKYSLVKNKISKSSFREMLQKELNHMLSDTGNRKAADKLIQNLDANHDGRISFDEYWTLIGGITGPIAKLIREQEQQSSS